VLVERVVYWIFRGLILIGRPVPPKMGYVIARIIADICYRFFFPRLRKATHENLARVLDTSDMKVIEPVARRCLRNFGKYVVDFIHFHSMTPHEVRDRITFDDYDALNEAFSEGHGIIFPTLHFGNWDMGAAGLSAYGFPVNVIAETFEYDAMNALVQGTRRHLGMKIIPMEKVGPGVMRALHRGELLALLIDGPDPGNTVTVDFFGVPTEVPEGPARIALHTGARVVPAGLVRVEGQDQMIRPVLDFSIRYDCTADREADVRNLTQKIMSSLERLIRQHPDQWFRFQPMWPQAQPMLGREPLLAGESSDREDTRTYA
jgi:lauroyl/myristoyl acyltransferase